MTKLVKSKGLVNQVAATSSDRVISQVEAVLGTSFQQPINCCQTTAIAYALTALGYPTSVDDLLLTVQVNIESAVGDGMTLAETHDMALRYIDRVNLPVFCECYHFDEGRVTSQQFWDAMLADSDAGSDDVCVLNFSTAIAHEKPKGGGHFGLVVGPLVDKAEIVIADVHPLKYGALWSQSYLRLFDAMTDKDSCGRSRGMLRFGLTAAEDIDRPFPSLAKALSNVDWVFPPDGYTQMQLRHYIPRTWDAHLGARNMAGVSAVAKALDVLDEHDDWDLDEIMRILRESYTFHLNEFAEPETLYRILVALSAKKHIARPSRIPVPADLTGATLKALLLEQGVGAHGTCILVPHFYSTAMTGVVPEKPSGDIDIENVSEQAVLSHSDKAWSLVAAIDPNAPTDADCGVVMASAHDVIVQGQLWHTSFDRLAAAIQSMEPEFLIWLDRVDDDELLNHYARIDRLIAILDADGDGVITAEELKNGFAAHGLDITLASAQSLIAEVDSNGDAVLQRSEALELFSRVLGRSTDRATTGEGFEELSAFLNQYGSEPNVMGFSTCHLAMKTADVRKCASFYNNILGWPLYNSVNRAHAGTNIDDYGVSWVSFGAFASFLVFQEERPEIGTVGHGPWAREGDAPPGLRRATTLAGLSAASSDDTEVARLVSERFRRTSGQRDIASSVAEETIAFEEVPFPFLGVVLERAFFDKQMRRIAEQDPRGEVRFVPVTGVEQLFGGDVVDAALALRDPDGYPIVFFVSKLQGDAYSARFGITPFVHGRHIRVDFPDDEARTNARVAAELKRCPILGDTGDYVRAGRRKERDSWLETFVFGADGLAQHEHHYETLMRYSRHGKTVDKRRKVVQLDYEKAGHFLVLRSATPGQASVSAMEDAATPPHRKDHVSLPHFGVNTDLATFKQMDDDVRVFMNRNRVPRDVVARLADLGHAPALVLLDSYNSLFTSDPDTCMSLLVNDPSGGITEHKWYLDFGEIIQGGKLGKGGLAIDNSMVEDHFPSKAFAMIETRTRRSD